MKATDELATSTPGAADDAAGHTGVRRDTRSLRLATTLLWLVALGGLAQVALSLWFIVTGRLLFALGEGANPYLRLDRLPQLMQADLREGSDGIRLVELDWWIRALAWLPSISPAFCNTAETKLAHLTLLGTHDCIGSSSLYLSSPALRPMNCSAIAAALRPSTGPESATGPAPVVAPGPWLPVGAPLAPGMTSESPA